MTRRIAALLLLALLSSLVVLANEAPSMEDQVVTTYRDTPVTLLVRASDPDIDPLHPDAHPLTFVLLDGPSHGVLVGDLTRVYYEGPHAAYVQLRYEPADGFVGTDFLVLTVSDPFHLTATGVTTIQIDVRPRTQGALSGSMEGRLTVNVQPGSVKAFADRLTEAYRLGPLTVQGTAEWRLFEHPSSDVDETRVRFDALRFQADARLEWLSVNASLVLEPTPIQTQPTAMDFFDYALVMTRFMLYDVSFTHTFFLDQQQANSYQNLAIRGSVAGVEYSSTTTLGMESGCSLSFRSERVAAEWTWCALRLYATLTLTETGFDELTAKLDDYAIPGFGWTGGGLYLDVTLKFTVDEKTVTPAISLKTIWIDCVRAYGELVSSSLGGTSIDGVSVYGLRIEHTLGGVSFESSTSFDPAKNATMTGQVDYFELLRISGTMSSCCGSGGTWSIATYFQNDHAAIMGWGMTVAKADVMLGQNVSASLQMTCRTGGFGDPKLELTFGGRLRW
jgi:hypothetical protein